MSKQLLYNLNGRKNGELKKFLDNFNGEPRIAWYPSAGNDFRALLYLHPEFSRINPASKQEPKSPDIFLFTDYYFRQNSSLFSKKKIYSDSRTSVSVESVEELPKLHLSFHEEIIPFPECFTSANRAWFFKINITSNKLGAFSFPVLYLFVENEAFCGEKLIPNNAKLSHIIHVRYGGGAGGGGNASGVWLLNALKKFNCELFITDNHHPWQSGDKKAIELYPILEKPKVKTNLEEIKVINSFSWSGHGDVSWYLVA